MAYYDTYRDQMASLYHGHALWEPDPAGLYDRVQVADVGFVRRGHFLRLFNALLPHDHPSQGYGVPDGFVPLNMGPFGNICKLRLPKGGYCSNTVTVDHGDRHKAAGPDEGTNVSFRCRRDEGAFLSLPFDGDRKDAIRTKDFEAYIRKHCDSWLEFALANGLDVRLEDIIMVTGCDLIASWAMAAFVNSPRGTEISLQAQISGAGSARFQWSPTSQPHNNESDQNIERTHCVFIRGYRAKRILPFFKTLKAAAEPRPDDPDNEPESSIELLREPYIPDYRDPLLSILDYITEKCPDQELAIAHEDDLKMIGGVDVLAADAVESFMRQNEIPVKIEKGVALLADEDEEEVPDEEKMTFYAQADVGGEQLPLTVHPVLMKHLLKFDINQPVGHDFGLHTEELLSSAVHPPVHVLVLENEQGLPQIVIQASYKGSGIGVTVEDVLKTTRVSLRKFYSRREWAGVNTKKRSGGIRQIDYLRGRNRLQVFPEHPLPGDLEGTFVDWTEERKLRDVRTVRWLVDNAPASAKMALVFFFFFFFWVARNSFPCFFSSPRFRLAMVPLADFLLKYAPIPHLPYHLTHYVRGATPLSTQPVVLSVLTGYLATIFGIREIMKTRQAQKLTFLFQVYNAVISSGSALLLVLMLEEIIPIYSRHGVFHALCGAEAWTERMELYYIINYYIKYLELLDTVFLALKKKPIAFLHVYHHSATAFLCFTQLNGKISISWSIITQNLAVHVLMYYYYYATAGGAKIRWKKYLTTMQIVQFIVDLHLVYFGTYSYFASTYWPQLPVLGTCHGTESAVVFGCALLSNYLLLFIKFYIDTYKKPARGKKSVMNRHASANGNGLKED